MIREVFDVGMGVPGLGDWRITLKAGTEGRLLGPHVDPNAYVHSGGNIENWKYDTLCITPGPLSPGADRATVLAAAIYSGRILDFDFGDEDGVDGLGETWTIGGDSILGWLGDGDSPGKGPIPTADYNESAPYTGTAADYLLGLLAGTDTNGIGLDGTAASMPASTSSVILDQNGRARELINTLCLARGVGYVMRPNGTCYFGALDDATDTLWRTTPRVLFGRGVGADRAASMVSYEASIRPSFSYRSEANSTTWRSADRVSTAGGTKTGRLGKDFGGSDDARIDKFVGTSETARYDASSDALDTAWRRSDEVKITCNAMTLRSDLAPGDYCYVYDPRRGLLDSTVQLYHAGKSLAPVLMRCAELQYPVHAKNGVYVIHNSTQYTGANAVENITNDVVFESGRTTVVLRNLTPATIRRTIRGLQFRPTWATV